MDEPTLGLDADDRRMVWEFLKERQRGKTIMVTSQLAEEAEVLADRVAVLNRGKVQCCGTPKFLAQKYGEYFKIKNTSS